MAAVQPGGGGPLGAVVGDAVKALICFWEIPLPQAPISTQSYFDVMLPGADGPTVAPSCGPPTTCPRAYAHARPGPKMSKGVCLRRDDYLPSLRVPILLRQDCRAATGCARIRRRFHSGRGIDAFSFHGRTIDFEKLSCG